MSHTGIEHVSTNFIQLPSGTQPYHYFEAWSVAFFSKIIGGNFWVTQNIIFHPIIMIITYIGFRSFSEKNSFNIPAMFFGILILFSSGYVFEYFKQNPFLEWTKPFENNLIDEPWWTRLSVLYPIIIASYHFYVKNELKTAIVILMIIPFLSVTLTIPILITSFGVIFFMTLLYRKKTNWKWNLLLIPVIAAILYKGFYMLFGDTAEIIKLPTLNDILVELRSISIIKTKIVIASEKIIQTLILFLPLIFIYLFLNINAIKRFVKSRTINIQTVGIILFILILLLTSVGMWQVLDFIFGSSFFYYYTIIPFVNILLIFGIWKAISSFKLKKVVQVLTFFYLIVFFSLLVNRSILLHNKAKVNQFTLVYSAKFLNTINSIVQSQKMANNLQLGVKFEDHNEIVHPFYNDGISLCGYYIYGIMNSPALISMSRANIPRKQLNERAYFETFTKQTSFYRYVKNMGGFKTNEELDYLKLQFVKSKKIRFGVVSPNGQLPILFQPIVDKVITDSKSKEKFILFKY